MTFISISWYGLTTQFRVLLMIKLYWISSLMKICSQRVVSPNRGLKEIHGNMKKIKTLPLIKSFSLFLMLLLGGQKVTFQMVYVTNLGVTLTPRLLTISMIRRISGFLLGIILKLIMLQWKLIILEYMKCPKRRRSRWNGI